MHSVSCLKKWYNQLPIETASSPPSSPNTPLSNDKEIAAGGVWQRHTPHAEINVLWAEQLEAAEGQWKTGELYERNIIVLMGKNNDEESVGFAQLAVDLKWEQLIWAQENIAL